MTMKSSLICILALYLLIVSLGQKPHSANNFTASHQKNHHLKINCPAFLEPILQKRNKCISNATEQVDAIVYFASDYNYILPFIIHHLSLGFGKIWIYNNDDKVAWYRHPAIICLLRDHLINIQPWFGEKGLLPALDHSFKTAIPHSKRHVQDLSHVWGAVFDTDELLVLHQDTCVNTFVAKYPAASVILVNWAFFMPSLPLTPFGMTGDPVDMTAEQLEVIRNSSDISHIEHDIILPHDMTLRRTWENPHVKSINRVSCTGKWSNEHCSDHKEGCGLTDKAIDPDGHFFARGYFTPYVDNHYPIAQLNHYWTLSLADFTRKIHRGYSGGAAKSGDGMRGTEAFFDHAPQADKTVNDTLFHQHYGKWWNELKGICPRCFDVTLYHL